VTGGLIVLVLVLGGSLAAGLTWRQRNGRMRDPRRPAASRRQPGIRQPAESRQAAGPARAAGAGPAASSAPGMPGPAASAAPAAGLAQDSLEPAARELAITSAELGVPLGAKATLVQFSTAFCAPCRATRRILADVAGMTTGVTHVEIDAESRLDLVRSLDVRRTPTVFVLGPDGRIAKRASGQPRKADVIAALGEVT
jgi:thiol-disulfide isomerase/thioredoxin